MKHLKPVSIRSKEELLAILLDDLPDPKREITADDVNRMTLRRMYEEYGLPYERYAAATP